MTCPYCRWVLAQLVARSVPAGGADGPGEGAVVVCYRCKRPSVVEGGELRAETTAEHFEHLESQAVTDVIARSLLRDVLGGAV